VKVPCPGVNDLAQTDNVESEPPAAGG